MANRGGLTVKVRNGVLAALAVLSTGACNPMDDALVAIFGRSMREQPAIQSYQNPLLPPEGSISFASGNFPVGPGVVNVGQPEGTPVPPSFTPIQLLQGIPEINAIENPVAADEGSLTRGEVVYNRACVPCHALDGAGDGPVTRAGVPQRSILTEEARALSDGYLYTIIRMGRGAMPAYAHQLTHYDRWHVVNYVRQLQANSAGQED